MNTILKLLTSVILGVIFLALVLSGHNTLAAVYTWTVMLLSLIIIVGIIKSKRN